MRLYSFTHCYMSPIQHGIQTGHLTDSMTVEYILEYKETQSEVYKDWIKNHKTYIVLNGGNSRNIADISNHLEYYGEALKLPYGTFCEDEDSMEGILTCVGIVVPECYYDATKDYFTSNDVEYYNYVYTTNTCEEVIYEYDSVEWHLINLIKSYKLA